MMRFCLAFAALAAAVPAPAAEPVAVPAGAYGFAHVKLQTVWRHDMLAVVRDTVTAAGPKALAAYGQQVYPAPATFESVTAFAFPLPEKPGEPGVVGVIAFNEAYDAETLRKLHFPKASAMKVGAATYYDDPMLGVAVAMPGAKELVVGPAASVAAWLAKPLPMPANLPTICVAVNVKALPIPPDAERDLLPDFAALLAAEQIVLSLDMSAKDPVASLRVRFPSEAAASEGRKALLKGAGVFQKKYGVMRQRMEAKLFDKADVGPRNFEDVGDATVALLALGSLNRTGAWLANPPIKVAGNDLAASATIPGDSVLTQVAIAVGGISISTLVPIIQKVLEAAANTTGQNNLKQIGLAMHGYLDANETFPAAAVCDKDGKPLLSWRVAILPYIGQDKLYKEFKLDEPWDSEHNKKLIARMPKMYASPRYDAGEGKTVYKVIVGNGAAFDTDKGAGVAKFADGMSNTIMAVDGGEGVTWTKPDDITFDPKNLPKLELPNGLKTVNVLLGDASVRAIDLTLIKPATLRAAITRAGGDLYNWDD